MKAYYKVIKYKSEKALRKALKQYDKNRIVDVSIETLRIAIIK